MKQAAILCRVSTEIQDYERQIDLTKENAKRDGYGVSDDNVYAEKMSGFTEANKRAELERLFKDIEEGKKNIQMIYAEDTTRLARNPRIVYEIVERGHKLGVGFDIGLGVGRTLNEDGTENQGAMMILGIMAAIGKKDADTMKIKFASGKKQGAKDGRFTGGVFKPFGYRTRKDTGNIEGVKKEDLSKLVIYEEEAEHVRTMFNMVLDGFGSRQIANYLNSKGIGSRGGGNWVASVVVTTMKNPMYKGLRRYKVQSKTGASPAKYEYYAGVPAIVNEQTFDDAMRIFASRNFKKDKNVKYLYLLQGRILCGVCGQKYVPKYKSNKSSSSYKECHYGCYSRVHAQSACNNAGIGIPKLESLVWSLVQHHPQMLTFMRDNHDELKRVEGELTVLQFGIVDYEKQLQAKTEERKKVIKLYRLGVIEDKEMMGEVEKIDKAIKTVELKIETAKRTIQSKRDFLTRIANADNHIKEILAIGNDRLKMKEVIPHLVDKVVINSAKFTQCDEYIISVWFVGSSVPISVYFNKRVMFDNEDGTREKGMIQVMKPELNEAVRYDEKYLLLNDVNELIELVKTVVHGRAHHEGFSKFGAALKIEEIPFSLVDIGEREIQVVEESKAA